MRKINKYKLIAATIVILVSVVSALLADKTHIPQRNDEELLVHFIDVGEADCSYIELPDGKTLLIDAGEVENGEQVAKYIKDRGAKKIDFLIGTHPHADHIGGLAHIIENFDIGKIYMPKVQQNSRVFENTILAVKDKNKTIISPKAGDVIYEKDDLKITVLSPQKSEYDSLNNYSIILKIVYKNNAFLFTGDAENEVLRDIKSDVSADVLKVAHHGSFSSGDEGFMERVDPSYAVIPVGKDNQYGHPHWEILALLDDMDVQVYRTDEDGTVVVSSDGNKINIAGLGAEK